MLQIHKQKFSNIFGSSFAFWFARRFAKGSTTKIIFTASAHSAENLHKELSFLLPAENIAYLPSYDAFAYQAVRPNAELVACRIDAFLKIKQKKPLVIISQIQSLADKLPIFEQTEPLKIVLHKEYSRVDLAQKLVSLGYVRMDLVEEKGEFAWRGEVLDIFPIQQQEAYRINFFGDKIDRIKLLHTQTQLSKQEVTEFIIFPAREIIPSEQNIAQARDCFRQNRQKFTLDSYQESLSYLEQGDFLAINKYRGYFSSHLISWILLLAANTELFLWEAEQLDFALQNFLVELSQEYQNIATQENLPALKELYWQSKEIADFLASFNSVEIFQDSEQGASDCSFYSLADLFSKAKMSWQEKLAILREKTQEGSKVIFCVAHQKRLTHLHDILVDSGFLEVTTRENALEFFQANTSTKNVWNFSNSATEVLDFPLQKSFFQNSSTTNNYYFVTEKDLWQKRNAFQKTKKINALKTKITDLKIGNFVVHIEYGIGKYLGLQSLASNNQREDFLVLEYALAAKLYVRIDEINYKIQKYNIVGDLKPQLDKLGSKRWSTSRKKVEQGVYEIAEGLIRIQAERMSNKRSAFCPDQKDISAFADDFTFVETEDQLQAIEDIYKDLSSEQPMDRLVCGDAGFGKTEVAMRAAFQVAITGFQVLVLAPTTVLVKQHFHSFCRRFKNFPVRIEFISSFLSPSQAAKNVTAFHQKKIEILIGTHALLHKNFSGDAIGLLIIDEEHRFGVKQKEKLREFRASVDLLSLSATPIPRTLNISLLGIRDISLITTPPQDRKQIKTKVLYYEEAIIQEAVRREVNRGGQVFILYNEVASIESFLAHLQTIIPQYKIGLAHGQIPKEQLEKIMLEFSENKFPILLCSTIIESGLDLPNANSLIVYNAACFGLSQLYQIRGRVGRSNRHAYAYFLLIKEKEITQKAKQRLSILQEIQGRQGYKIATQDLELRGVGNLVGVEQSGHIQTVGYDLFMAMIEESIQRIRQETDSINRNDIRIFSYLNGYIPEKFIENMSLRLYTYQTMNQCYDEQKIADFQEELTDRFGVIPTEVCNLFEIIRLKNLAHKHQVVEINLAPDNIKIKLAASFPIKTRNLLQLAKNPAIKFLPSNCILLQKEVKILADANTEIQEFLKVLR